ncbi:CID11 [Panicum miliaceum]|uniref:CID11 n=1 Tax=Panicum miliaceum TaxID=4540 RepID=A0A3L6PNT1_PANMI|nr:CID11 [Panicum miliaceum]
MAVAEAAAADHAAPRPEEAPGSGSDAGEREMRDLEELLSKLNPMAEEFVPPSLASLAPVPALLSPAAYGYYPANAGFAVASPGHRGVVGFPAVADGPAGRGRKKGGAGGFGGHGHPGRRRTNSRTSMAQRDEVIRRTVYVSDIDHQVTEENLAALFINCGQVVDCRMCGDPNSVLRFAFIEFTDEEGARAALNLSGTVLGYYPVRVLPSKTAIAPVNPTFLPRSDDEREMCARTIYCTNIDKKVTQADLKLFFESICGEFAYAKCHRNDNSSSTVFIGSLQLLLQVFRLRLLGDYHHSTRIAFVEFVMAESATAALNCSGVILGSLPIRVSPSKTPVRPRAPRQLMH